MEVVLLVIAAVLVLLYVRERSRVSATERRSSDAVLDATRKVTEQTQLADSFRQDAAAARDELLRVGAAADELKRRLDRIEGLGAIEDAFLYSDNLRKLAEEQLVDAQAELRSAKEQGETLRRQYHEDALLYSAGLRTLAEEQLVAAQTERRLAREQGDALLLRYQQDATRLAAEAKTQADGIVVAAEQRARELAGSAIDLAQREEELRRSVRALENIIGGYGDEYLLPTSSLLDELQERYGFTDAGAQLKESRAKIARMIKEREAATCDYVETSRRDTAIAFVLDAFNGKADSILADVRHDNYGKLMQKLLDAFHLVNHLGRSFRNARILGQYRDAQVDLLKWSVAAQELKRQEKEEQRALKDRLREEERAQKEFERALKEASRDEEVARKAVAKVQADLERASDAERVAFEVKLAELTARLQAAEERGQRALSMAQQTRAGNVYVISNVGSFGDDVLKIGMTRRLEPEDRVRELGDASVPFGFDIHAMIQTNDAPALEKALHRTFLAAQINKVNPRKEFFRIAITDVRKTVEQMGIQASWTMAAACREWRETQALEARVLTDKREYEQWAASQIRDHDRVVELEARGELIEA